MKKLFDDLSYMCSKNVTQTYSTSFTLAVNLLSSAIRPAIHSIYGFVRCADEIVDSFHGWDKEQLLNDFEKDLARAFTNGISLNPILNSFQHTAKRYRIDNDLIKAFLKSMRMDLFKHSYQTKEEYENYIYGSADVVGLMCLKVFVNGDTKRFEELKPYAMKLGSAFQKVNFLRDINSDTLELNRHYFPNLDIYHFDAQTKSDIITDIEHDFREAYKGIVLLPPCAKLGVYTAYVYYNKLLGKLKRTPAKQLMQARIRVSDYAKMALLLQSVFSIKLNIV